MDEYGVNPVLSGLVQAFSMANVMKHQRMQQEQLQLQKNKDARQEEHEKFGEKRQGLGDQMAALNSGAKPLDQQGQYSEESRMPLREMTQGSDSPALRLPSGFPDPTVRLGGIPADPGRTAKINGQNYQLPTRAEQDESKFEQATRIGQANANAHANAQIFADQARIKTQHEEDQVQIPGQPGPVSRHAIPYLTEVERNKGQNDRDEHDRKSREDIAARRNETSEKVAGIRAATPRGGGLTANAEAVQNRFTQRQLDQAKKANQADQMKEQELWRKYGDEVEKLKDTNLNDLFKAKSRNDAAGYKKQIDELQKVQKERTEKFGGTYSNGAAPEAGNPYKTAEPAANPYR